MRLTLLDTPHLRRGAQRLDLPDTLPGTLLALLAQRGDWMQRETLAALCWPDASQADAQHNLSVNLSRLRPLLAAWGLGPALLAERRRVRVDLATDVAEMRAAAARGDWVTAARTPAGPFLHGLGFRAFPALDAWAQAERAALQREWRDAALRAAPLLRPADALDLAQRCRGHDPFDEELLRLQVGALAALDQRDDARRLLLQFVERHHAEFGIAPSADFLDSARRGIGDGDAAAPAAPAAPATPFTLAGTPAPAGGAVLPRGLLQPRALVGRSAALERLADPAQRVLCVAGEAGAGKTRLLEEVWAGAPWLRCRAATRGVALAPLAEYLDDQHAALPPLRGAALVLARLAPSLARGETLPDATGPADAAALLAAAAELLESQGAAIVVDDLQWADALSCQLVMLLARRGRVRLALCFRPGELSGAAESTVAALQAELGACRVDVAPLDAAAFAALLRSLDPGAGPLAAASSWLARRSAGNPYYAIALLRSLFDDGVLDGRQAGWADALEHHVVQHAQAEVPARLVDLTRQRLRDLSETTQRVLAVAALAGGVGHAEALAQAAGVSPWACAEALLQAEMLGLTRGAHFAHDLLRESLVAATPEPLRRWMHAQIGQAMAGVLAPEAIAAHFWAAGDSAAAVRATLDAVQLARVRGLQAPALALVEAAQAQPLGNSAARASLHAAAAQLRMDLVDTQGAKRDALAALAEAALPPDRARALVVLGWADYVRGDLNAAQARADDAARSAPDDLEVLALQDNIAMASGRAADRLAPLRARVDVLRRQPPGPALIDALTSLGAVHDALDEPATGYALHHEALALARHLNARSAQVTVAINLAWCCSALPGRADEGRAVAEEALALGEYDASDTLRNNLAWIHRDQGRLAEALALYDALARGRDATLACLAHAYCADLMASLGHPDERVQAMLHGCIARLPSTDFYDTHALAIIVTLRLGTPAQREAVRRYLRPGHPLDASLQARLDAALQASDSGPEPPDPAPDDRSSVPPRPGCAGSSASHGE